MSHTTQLPNDWIAIHNGDFSGEIEFVSPDRTRDGRFIGELCSACHEALSTDTPMPTNKTLISSRRILATVMLDGWAYAQDDEEPSS